MYHSNYFYCISLSMRTWHVPPSPQSHIFDYVQLKVVFLPNITN